MLLQRVALGADAMSAREALWIATRGGAAVLGRDDVGQIAPGMRADLAVWDVSGIDSAGSWDPAALLLAGPRRVRELYVEGRAVVREGRLATVDTGRIAAEARASVRYLAALGAAPRSRSVRWVEGPGHPRHRSRGSRGRRPS